MELDVQLRVYLSRVLEEWLDYSKVGHKTEGAASQKEQ